VTSIGEQATEVEEIEITALDSPNGVKEYMSGGKDAGSIEVQVQVKKENAAQAEKLRAVFAAGDTRDWEIGLTTAEKMTFKAFISKFANGEITTEGLLTYSFTLRLSGEPTWS
jgi:predicted secreted protein